MEKQDNKLSMEEYGFLYSEDIPIGQYRKLLEKARTRMNYVIEYITETYFSDDMEYPLVYDNSAVANYGFTCRETDRDVGQFDPEQHKDFVTLIPQANEGCVREYPVHKFELIDIQKYKIIVNTYILFLDFEDDILGYINAHGDPEEMRQLEVEQRHREFQKELQAFRKTLTKKQERLIDQYIDFSRWEQLKEWDDFYK
jgi:hypothetical protein